MPVGERISHWAEKFIGTPYDPDPLGEYVTKKAIVADERVDCMYLTFRSAELALSNTPEEAVERALELRFIEKGRLNPDGSVANYEERYQYAEDMVYSGKWGKDITASIGKISEELASSSEIEGSRGRKSVIIVPKGDIPASLTRLKSGDIVFFVKDPAKRVVGEIIGHIGIIKKEGDSIYLIHASGNKGKVSPAGEVKKVLFPEYIEKMRFVGIIVTRFGE